MPPTSNKNNPANRQSELFKRLTRLFSGPIINYRSQTGRKMRRQHLDKFSARFKSAAGQQFKKTLYNPLDTIATNAIQSQRRNERYVDFDQMEYMPEIASAMDIYADEMTTFSSLSPMLKIKCANEEIRAVLDILFDNILNLQYNLFGWARTMCKYGDFFLYLDIDEKFGVKSVIALPPPEIERLEGQDSTNPNYVQYQWNSAAMTFENWQIAHFRILGHDKYAPYGTSILEPARRIWRQLTLAEDAMMAYRVVRSSERRVFKIDVGAIPPQDVEQYMEKIVTQLKRHSVINKDTGRVDLRYNPMSIEEDYFIPVRPGSVTDIQNLAGGTNTTQIDDVKYLRDKLFSALKIPQSYLTMGEGGEEDKTTLAQKDIRFARTIQRLQRVLVSELTKIGIIHLYTLGFRGDDLLSFNLALNNPSKIAELQELEHWKQKFDIAGSATEGYFSRRWVADHVFGMSTEEFARNQREMYYDRKHDASLQAVAEATAMGPGGADMGLGSDMPPAGGGGPMEITPGEADTALPDNSAAAPDAAGAPADSGSDSALVAVPPGNRDFRRKNKAQRTPNDKGKEYFPKRDGSNYNNKGRRKVSLSRAAGTHDPRKTVPGLSDIMSLVKTTGYANGITTESDYNEVPSIYNLRERTEEDKLFEVNHSVRDLILELETKTSTITEQKNED